MERRGTTRDSTARGIGPDLCRWEFTSFVGIVSHLLSGSSHPQVLGSSPTGPTSFPLAALRFWDGVRRERLVLGADCVTSEKLTHALLRGRMFVGAGQVISPPPAPVRCQQKCATNVFPVRDGITDLQICPVPSLEVPPMT
jgi:hypothetical protein